MKSPAAVVALDRLWSSKVGLRSDLRHLHPVFQLVDGGIMFKVFVARDEQRELLGDQLTAFRALADRYCQNEK